MINIWHELIYFLFFVVYTSVRSPLEFCNKIETHAFPHSIDENGNILIGSILQQQTHDQSIPNDPYVSSTGFGKGKDQKKLDIDLNKPPPDEDE